MSIETTDGIHERAMLVSVRFSCWGARAQDNEESADVAERHRMDAAEVRVSKILTDAESYTALAAAIRAGRADNKAKTLPWCDKGWRLLPTKQYAEHKQWGDDCKRSLEDLTEEFLQEYPDIQEAAPRRMNGLYKPEDWPTVDKLRKRFGMSMEYRPIPKGEDIRCNLDAEQVASIRKSVEAGREFAIRFAMSDAWRRLHDVVERMHERLADPDARLYDSIVTNVRETCDVLARLNVTNDGELERLRQLSLDALTRLDPDTLRSNDAARSLIADAAGSILTSIRGTRRITALPTQEAQ